MAPVLTFAPQASAGCLLGGEQPQQHQLTMTNNEFLISRIGKRVSAYMALTHGNVMFTGILSRTPTGWEIGDDPTNSLNFSEAMVNECHGTVIFMHFQKL